MQRRERCRGVGEEPGQVLAPIQQVDAVYQRAEGGYNRHEAYYLYHIGVTDMRTASPDRSLENSNLYQNINWPTSAGGHAEK